MIGGILLGPTAMGRIPGFQETLFPSASMPPLALAANLGLVLFLFLVGLECDLRLLISNWRVALSVGALGMALPFGLGAALAYGLYNQFKNEPGLAPIAFPIFMLFVGIAMAITAFPVLCRILTELKLLNSPVGIIVLSAGVGNDVVGWILLALCVALVNSGTGLTALYVLLTAVGYCLFLAYAIRPAFMWILRRSGSIQNGPSQTIVALTLLLVLASSFFTSAIGIHAIFGAFMIGLICPHEGGFAVKIVEKLEDIISVLLLPLYFALSGLSTNIGLLDNGITWAYVIGVVCVAFFAKVIGGLVAARVNGLLWRESATIGVLMSCKGLVELIVLNIGLQARILSTRTFTIFVVMALVTTFATTPLTHLLYPESYQKKLDLWKKGKIDWDGNPIVTDDSQDKEDAEPTDQTNVRKMLLYLRLDGLPSLFTFINLLGDHTDTLRMEQKKHHLLPGAQHENEEAAGKRTIASRRPLRRPLEVHGLRLMELTERDSSVMKVSEIDEYAPRDPVVKAFRTFGQFSDVAVAGNVAVVPERSYADTLIEKAEDLSSDFVLIPWSETGSMSEQPSIQALAKSGSYFQNAGPYLNFLNEVFDRSSTSTNIGVFVDRAEEPIDEERHHKALTRTTTGGISIYSGSGRPTMSHSHPVAYHTIVPYFGTDDDRFAVHLAIQLARKENVTATIMHFAESSKSTLSAGTPRTMSVAGTESSSAEDEKEANGADEAAGFFTSVRDNLPASLSSRVVFQSYPLNLIGASSDIVAAINKSITATANDNSIEHIVICSRSNSTVLSTVATDVNIHNTVAQTPKTAGTNPGATPSRSLLSPMATALGMQGPITPGSSNHNSGEIRVLGGLGCALLEATGSGALRAGVLVVQAKRKPVRETGSKTDVGVTISEA